jgi:hypothetical protein
MGVLAALRAAVTEGSGPGCRKSPAGPTVYALFPVIADVALRRGSARRRMPVSSVAAQGITASPVAAAVTAVLGYSSRVSSDGSRPRAPGVCIDGWGRNKAGECSDSFP